MRKTRAATIASAIAGVAAVLVCAVGLRAADYPGRVQGVVKTSAGAPVSGALVKLINAGMHLTFMVSSQAGGRYTAGNLPPGNYTVQGIGNDFQSDVRQVRVTADRPATMDLLLTAARAPALAPGWPGTPGVVGGAEVWIHEPPITLPDGDGRRILESNCTQCHEAKRITLDRLDRAGWENAIRAMRGRIQVAKLRDLTEDEQKILLEYLVQHFSGKPGSFNPSPDPNSRLPRTLLTGAQTRFVAVDFEIPRPYADPHEITVDAEGNGWISQRSGCCLGKLDVKTLVYTEVPVPPGPSPTLRPDAIVKGPGNNLWIVDIPNRRWMEFDPKTSQFKIFPVPDTLKGDPGGNTMRVHPNGTVWAASIGSNAMFKLDPRTGEFSSYQVPSGIKAKRTASPYGFAIAGDGKIWFAEYAMNAVGRIDPNTGRIDEFPVPVENGVPRKVGSDADGNIWVGLHESGQLLKIDYETEKMSLYTPPTKNSGMYSVCGDLKNNVIWFSEQGTDKIGRFDPKTNTFTEFPLPYPETDVRRIEVDQNYPNRIWWAGEKSNRMGYIEVLN